MKTNLIVVMLLMFAIGGLSTCGNSPQGLEEAITQMENKLPRPYSSENAKQLIKAYQDYVSTYPDRDDQNAIYLRKAGQAAIDAGQYDLAAELLSTAIKDHFSAKSTQENILLLADVYSKNLKNEVVAASILQSGQKQFPSSELLAQHIDPAWPALINRLKTLKEEVVDTVKKQINYSTVNDYIISCAAYAMILPKDTLSPSLLFQAGQLAHQTQSHNKALELLDWMYLEYPKHPMAPDALFLNGYILDSELKRFEEAKQRYEAFLEKYPQNEFAETTQFLLDNLGVPAEEIIKRFENQ